MEASMKNTLSSIIATKVFIHILPNLSDRRHLQDENSPNNNNLILRLKLNKLESFRWLNLEAGTQTLSVAVRSAHSLMPVRSQPKTLIFQISYPP